MKKVRIIKHYPVRDESCSGDYYSIDIEIDGEVVASYGDAYHDRGADKVAGYLDCLDVYEDFETTYVYVADADE